MNLAGLVSSDQLAEKCRQNGLMATHLFPTFAPTVDQYFRLGTPQQPVFLVDHQAIRFDVSRAARATVDVDEKLSRRAARTSIETGELDRASPPPALALLVDPASDRVTLHASDWLPPEHLPQIGKQLASLVNWLHGPSTQPMPWRAVDGLMLAVLNPAPAVMPGARLLHHLVRKTSTQHADAIEFLHGDGTKEHYSYERLHDRSDALAARIRGMLVTDDDVLGSRQRIIPILMSQRPELYVALLAVLKAGAAFCPVDLDAPEQRLKHVAQDVAARLVITEVSLESRVTWEHGPSVLVTDCPNDRDANAEEIHGYTPTPDDLAYVMYTSGSTGLPKAVAVSHAAVTQSILAHEQHLPPFHRFLQFAAPSFDVSIFEIFFPLFRGATLVGCHRDGLLTRLPSVMHDMEIDAAELTPTVAGALLRTRKQVPGLRLLLTIGELLTSSVVQEFGGSNDTPNILHAMYGPTEAAIHCTLVSPCSRDAKPANIGKPLETVSALVIAADDPAHVRPLPVGHVGELAVGGHQLAHGYLNHPAKTKAAFAFSSEHGRVYRTGDKARLLPDGTLQFLGRITSGQVKLRGQRVELSEVEYAVDQSPDVHSPTAVVIDGILVVFALRTDATSRVTSVMDACRRWLPSFMRPGDVVLLDDFPRSSSGKIDRRSLEHSYREAGGEQHLPSKDVETWTETESIIREILSSLSGYPIQNISRTVTIFQLGIDSLAAAQIATQLREQEVAVTVSDVLEHPSPAALAEHLRTNLPSSTSDTPSFAFASFDKEFRALVCKAASIDPSLVEAVRPCTPLVAGIVARFVQSQGSMYLNHYLLRWPRLDRRRLRTAWDLVTKNHDMLRTGFCETGDPHHPFVMITYRAEEGGVPHVDDPVPSHPLVATQDLRHRWSAEMVSRLHAPAWRWSVIEDRETCLVQVSVLHALYDAISLQCFLADLARAYHAHPLAPTESVEPAMASILHSSQAAPPGRDHFWRKLGETMHISKFPTITSTRVESQKVVVRSMRSTWSLAQLAKACQTNGIALQAAGQAAWARILAAYLGDDNVTFGLILSGRLASHLTATVAFPCISTVPMVCSLHGDNISLVRRIMHLSHGLLEHQHTPSSTIQRLTGHVGHALFDTVFAFQKLPTFVEDQARPWTIIEEVATAEFPISIELEPTDEDDLDLRITFREDVLSAQQAEILLKQLDGVLIDTVLRPHQDCTDTSHLEASILSATPAVDAEIASEVSVLHGFVEEHARAMPDRVALEWTTDLSDDHLTRSQWTYRELNRFGNRVAHLLVTLGARPGGFIGICFDKCPQASFAILGILKAGCAFVALDPDAPAARKAFVIQDSGAHLVLTMSRRATELRGHTTASIYALDDLEALSRFPQAPVKLERPATPDDTCYCLYTSGTTGTPKGCEITHDNAVQFTLAFQRLLAGRWQPNSRFLQFASFHFDVSVMEQYWSWSVGICVTSAPRDLIFEDIARAIRRLEVTHVDLTPSLAKLISPEDAPALIDGAFITGGERLNQDVLDQWGPKLCIFNGYGPTEVTIGCTMNRRVPRDGNPANIGPQYDNVGSYVFRPGTAMLIPRGGIGELCVSGKLVGRGYLNRPELTQERFPYLDEFQERVYRTGDMVRVLYDGSFEYLGRVDDQVKLRGQRLEVHEINQVIRAGVKEVSEVVTLLAQHSASRREHLIAFFVTRPTKNGASRGQAQYDRHGGTVIRLARDACRHRLPAYMIPTFFVPLTAIPLSANNKADARELRELFSRIPIEQLRDLQQSLVRDRGPLSDPQKRVVEILAKMARVGAEDVQLESSIFTLGLDSITVISFARALREAGFSTAQTSVVLEHNTVGRLVDVLCRGGGTDLLRAPTEAADVDVRQRMAAFAHQHAFSVSRALHLPVDVIEGIAPCTALQEAMIARSTASGRPFYFSAFCYRLAEDMDLARFRDAWATVAEKAHILRTRFVSTADGHAQAVIKNAPLLWKEIHLQEDGDSSSAKALEFKTWHKQNQAMITTPFQLVIFRQRLEVQLGIFHHHALYDFWSHDLMLDRVMKEYKKASGISYGPSFQEVLVRGPLRRVEGASVFWTKLLAGAEYHPLPTREISECSVPPVTRHVTATGMEKLRRRLGTTHQAIIQACWIAVLRSILPSPVIIGTLVSGRSLDIEGIDETIGPLFNTVPFVIHLDPTDTWADLVRQCHDLNTSILPFQHTPLRDIMKWCNRSAGNPLFDIIFSFQKESQTMSTELEEVNSLHDEALLPDTEQSLTERDQTHCLGKRSKLSTR
ncbi:MAG: NRPS [Thelocarpon superellum]|nr:MAG: NRPS [Thelocarpon superellum]